MTTAAILVGGRADRYGGRDKGAIVVEGHAILGRQLAALEGVADDVLLVGRAGQRVEHAGTRPVEDRVAGAGPLAGLEAALAAARHDQVLLLACDMPFLTAPFLADLVARLAGADAVVPRTERGYHPLCAVYARHIHPVVVRHLAERRLKMMDLLAVIRTKAMGERELAHCGGVRLLANVNSPADFDSLETLHGHKR
jgi:molybdopterin-guanine dinucleotide biosynthesis protein A